MAEGKSYRVTLKLSVVVPVVAASRLTAQIKATEDLEERLEGLNIQMQSAKVSEVK